jgi:hypothetical protein
VKPYIYRLGEARDAAEAKTIEIFGDSHNYIFIVLGRNDFDIH